MRQRPCIGEKYGYWMMIGFLIAGCSAISPVGDIPVDRAPVAVDDTFSLPGTPHITLAWDDPNNLSKDVAGYYLYYWKADWEKPKRVDVGRQTTYTLSGLDAGETYHFAVSAHGAAKRESPRSSAISQRIAGHDGRARTLTVEAPGVLGNDYSADGRDRDALKATVVEAPTHGTVTLMADGGFIYTPPVGFTGRDHFTYQATDGSLMSNAAVVTIIVRPTPAL